VSMTVAMYYVNYFCKVNHAKQLTSASFTATNSMLGRCTASQIASASALSFFYRYFLDHPTTVWVFERQKSSQHHLIISLFFL
jgi:hypothetical protein